MSNFKLEDKTRAALLRVYMAVLGVSMGGEMSAAQQSLIKGLTVGVTDARLVFAVGKHLAKLGTEALQNESPDPAEELAEHLKEETPTAEGFSPFPGGLRALFEALTKGGGPCACATCRLERKEIDVDTYIKAMCDGESETASEVLRTVICTDEKCLTLRNNIKDFLQSVPKPEGADDPDFSPVDYTIETLRKKYGYECVIPKLSHRAVMVVDCVTDAAAVLVEMGDHGLALVPAKSDAAEAFTALGETHG